jgi:hypothetical protein
VSKKKSTGRKRGRPEGTGFAPTKEQQEVVRRAAAFLREEDIVKLVINPQTNEPISPVTLRKHFRNELDIGHVQANADVAGALFKNATTGTPTYPAGNPTAQIFWLKTRGNGHWKDKQTIELETPPSEMEEQEIDSAIERLLAKAKPGKEKAKRGSKQ